MNGSPGAHAPFNAPSTNPCNLPPGFRRACQGVPKAGAIHFHSAKVGHAPVPNIGRRR